MKKIALILDSLNRIFPKDGNIHGGANRVGKYLIEYFSSLPDVQLDIICGRSNIEKPEKVNQIFCFDFCPFSDMTGFFEKAKEIIDANNYDEVLTNDLFSPFGDVIVHSHTLMYKNKNCKNIFERIYLNFSRKKRIKNFKENFKNKDRKIFTVSNILKQDYIDNLGFDKDNVFVVYPGVDQREKPIFKQQEIFTFGIVAGNAINKGGYLFMIVIFLMKLMRKKFKAKMIVAKSNHISCAGFFLKMLNISDKIEVLSEQVTMDDFYNQIDCLVVPSINETFGLVVTEAATYGKPSIVTHTVGASEILRNGGSGFIFRRTSCLINSILNLYKVMTGVLRIPCEKFEKISNNAYEVSKQFLWDDYSRAIAEVLKLNI